MKRDKTDLLNFDKTIKDIIEMIQALDKGEPVTVKTPTTPSGPKITQEDVDRWNKMADMEMPTFPEITQIDIDRWNRFSNRPPSQPKVQKVVVEGTQGPAEDSRFDDLAPKVEQLLIETEDLDKQRGYIKDLQNK